MAPNQASHKSDLEVFQVWLETTTHANVGTVRKDGLLGSNGRAKNAQLYVNALSCQPLVVMRGLRWGISIRKKKS